MQVFVLCLSILIVYSIGSIHSYGLDSYDFIPDRFEQHLADHDDLATSPWDTEQFDTSNNRQKNIFEDDLLKYNRNEELMKQLLASLGRVDSSENDYAEQNYSPNEDNVNEIRNSNRDLMDLESEAHSSLIAGHQYVSGGAGEGKQMIGPDSNIMAKSEVKSDEDLPAYCDPPNPCPIGYKGEDCETIPYAEYTAEFSKHYQEQQNCMCDDDHNECAKRKSNDRLDDLIKNLEEAQKANQFSPVVAKKSPRAKRSIDEFARRRRH